MDATGRKDAPFGGGASPASASRATGPAARLRAAAAMVAVALLAAGAGCRREGPRPDVVLVTIDTLRADHCSSYGYRVPTTPHLDRLAASGVLFRRAYAESSTTAPSHAVLMTGRHFRSLGTTKNGLALPDEATTLAEALGAAGYATAAFVSSFPVTSRFGFSQGFEVYDDEFLDGEVSIGREKEPGGAHDRRGDATVARVARWLRGRRDGRPLFLWVHLVDPHSPYHAPEKFTAEWPRGTTGPARRYDGEVHYADAQLGALVTELESSTPAHEDLLVVTSDHGEGLGDHGWMAHGINLHEEAVRVPLVARWKGRLPEGRVVEDLAGIIDIAPGILDLLGIDAPTFSAGRPLFAGLDPARRVFLERRDYRSGKEKGRRVGGEMTAVVEGSSKLITAPSERRRELYDLAADPGETRDLLEKAGRQAAEAGPSPADREKARALEEALVRWGRDVPRAEAGSAPVDREAQEALRSLGYVD